MSVGKQYGNLKQDKQDAARLVVALREQGHTVREVAAITGIPRSTVDDWYAQLRGRPQQPSPYTLLRPW